MALAGAHVDRARGNVEAALTKARGGLSQAEAMTMRQLATQLADTAAALLRDLGRDAEAATMQARACATIEAMAALITDPERRETYRRHALARLGTAAVLRPANAEARLGVSVTSTQRRRHPGADAQEPAGPGEALQVEVGSRRVGGAVAVASSTRPSARCQCPATQTRRGAPPSRLRHQLLDVAWPGATTRTSPRPANCTGKVISRLVRRPRTARTTSEPLISRCARDVSTRRSTRFTTGPSVATASAAIPLSAARTKNAATTPPCPASA